MRSPVLQRNEPLRVSEGLGTVSVAGAELRYLRTGAGRPLVLLHTLRTQLEYFLPLLHLLDPARVEIIVPDLPGHGRSTAPKVAYTADYFTDVIGEFLAVCDLRGAVIVGESIGASIALGLAARRNTRVAGVVALNPYDYGCRGGIRRSSALANVLFSAMLLPLLGPIVAHTGTKGLLRRVMEGGLHDPLKLPPELVDEMQECGSLPGHARAFRSLIVNWKSWISARAQYAAITVPVTLAYADYDWSRPEERAANYRTIPGARRASLGDGGHFSCLEKPQEVARLIGGGASCIGRV